MTRLWILSRRIDVGREIQNVKAGSSGPDRSSGTLLAKSLKGLGESSPKSHSMFDRRYEVNTVGWNLELGTWV
jgi:hypothetical protein